MLVALAAAQTMVAAQTAVVTYGPVGATAVPTLSEWGMLAMALVLGVAAVYALRKQAHSKAVMSLALGAGALLTAALGGQVVQQARAVPVGAQLSNPAGGSISISMGSGLVLVQNSSQVPLRIISVTPEEVQNAPQTTCDPGLIVTPGATCEVDTGGVPEDV